MKWNPNAASYASISPGAPALAAATIAIACTINRRSLWLDEADTWYFSSLPFHEMFNAMRREDGALLVYYSILHVWQAFGSSAIILRSFSALCSIAAIAVAAAIANRIFDRTHAIVASLILALNAAFLYYAGEARPYGAVFFFAALSMYLFVRATYDGKVALVPWYAAAVGAAVYFHALAVLLPISQAASLFVVRPPRGTMRAFAWCYAALAVALVPLALLARRSGVSQIAWIPDLSRSTIRLFVENLAGTLPLSLIIALLVIVALWNARNEKQRRTLVLLSWSLGPILLGAIISLHQHIFIARYFLYTLIPLTILAAHGLLSLRRPAVRAVAALAMVAAIAHGVWYLWSYQREDWRSAVAYVRNEALAGDGRVVYVPFEVMPYRYAWFESGAGEDPALLYPADAPLTKYDRTSALPQSVLRSFAHRRVWVLLASSSNLSNTPLAFVSSYAQVVSIRRFQGVTVMLFAPAS